MKYIFQNLYKGKTGYILCTALLVLTSGYASAQGSGDKVFNTYCIACHMSGVAGAPRFGNKNDWQPHIDKGIDTLLQNAISGINAMPARGLCADCSDEELKSAIQYMIDNSQK